MIYKHFYCFKYGSLNFQSIPIWNFEEKKKKKLYAIFTIMKIDIYSIGNHGNKKWTNTMYGSTRCNKILP